MLGTKPIKVMGLLRVQELWVRLEQATGELPGHRVLEAAAGLWH